MTRMLVRSALIAVITFGMLLSPSYSATSANQASEISISNGAVKTAETPKATKKPAAEENLTEAVPAGKKVVAHVVWVKGTFKASEPGSATVRNLKKSSNVYMNDTLETSPDSEAQIVYTDNSLMSFRANTKFYINEYNYQPKGKEGASKSTGKYVMDLITGGFRTITGMVAKQNPDDYKVNTPVATIGVRGTEFSIMYADGKLYMKQYKGEPCLSKKGENGDKAQNSLCLDKDKKYASAEDGAEPQYLADEPAVFQVDVEVIPVTFANGGVGFCGADGCGSSGGGSGFCIQ